MRNAVFTLVYQGAIQPKQRPRTGLNRKTGRPIIYTDKETRACEEALGYALKAGMSRQGFLRVPKRFPVRVRLWFVRHDPSLPKGSMRYEIKKPDLDNLEKTVLDAMNKLVFEDDSQAAVKDSRKIVQNTDLGDCCLIEVSVLNDAPVVQAFNI